MSITQSSTSLAVCLSDQLSEQERQLFQSFIPNLPVNLLASTNTVPDTLPIVAVVDGRGLACPMPLLKTKVALRGVQKGQALYVIATDPNSMADIAAFCRQHSGLANPSKQESLQLCLQYQTDSNITNGLTSEGVPLRPNTTQSIGSEPPSSNSADTFFHFIITKTDSN